jgi:hypothetical protein
VFYRVEIGALGWPVECMVGIESVTSKPFLCKLGGVLWIIILLKINVLRLVTIVI